MPYRDAIAALEIKLSALREARRELDVSIAETRRELRRHYGARRRSWSGVAIALVVLAGTGLAGFFLLAAIFSACCCLPREDTAYTATQTIKGAAELYVARSSECPTVEDLVRRGLLNGDQQLTDGWDQPFRIECSANRVYVSSAGPDGVHGTCDDIASWWVHP